MKFGRNVSKRVVQNHQAPKPDPFGRAQDKPAFTNYPFAGSSPVRRPPPVSAQSWSGSSRLGNLRHPAEMDAEELGNACNLAARESVDSDKFWSLVSTRAKEISTSMEPRDFALILNGLSRMRRLTDPELIEKLAEPMARKLPYFTSVQISMALSGLAKSGLQIPPDLTNALVREVKGRLNEFKTPTEFSMLINAINKLQLNELNLIQRISKIVQSRLTETPFHIRDLSVIAHAFSQLGHRDTALFEGIAEKSRLTISEATPGEISKLIGAFARVNIAPTSLLELSLHVATDKLMFMTPTELVSTAFSLGQILEHIPIDQSEALGRVFEKLRFAALSSLPLFQPRDLASLLLSFSRWKAPFPGTDLNRVLNRLVSMSERGRLMGEELMITIQSVSNLCLQNSDNSENSKLIEKLIQMNGNDFLLQIGKLENNLIIRTIISINKLNLINEKILSAVSNRIVREFRSIDKSVKLSLYQSLASTGRDLEDDLMLVLNS
jgi:hypothetical protein